MFYDLGNDNNITINKEEIIEILKTLYLCMEQDEDSKIKKKTK